MDVIDTRPAAVPRPSPDMQAAMAGADVDHDQFGEGPSPGPDRAAGEPILRIMEASTP